MSPLQTVSPACPIAQPSPALQSCATVRFVQGSGETGVGHSGGGSQLKVVEVDTPVEVGYLVRVALPLFLSSLMDEWA